MAALCPIMQYHSEYNHHRTPSRDRTPWNVAERTGDPRVIPVFRRLLRLRERLVPYLANEGRKAVERRLPLMRALLFEVAEERARRFPSEYLLGDDLVVAPVTEEGATRWTVYVPAGTWVDAWSGERLEGPATVERPAPIDQIPVLVRSSRAAELLGCFRNLDDPSDGEESTVGAC